MQVIQEKTGTRSSSLKILLIEDNPHDSRLIKELLKENNNENIDLTQVSYISKAIELLKKERFDVILLDLFLPDSEGITSFERIHFHCSYCPIIIISGVKSLSIKNSSSLKAIYEGAQDYIEKDGIDAEKLIRAIYFAIGRQKILKDLECHPIKFEKPNTKDTKPIAINLSLKLAQGIIIVDKNGVVLSVNKEAKYIFEKSNGELIGSKISIPLKSNKSFLVELSTNNETKEFITHINETIWESNLAYSITFREIPSGPNQQFS